LLLDSVAEISLMEMIDESVRQRMQTAEHIALALALVVFGNHLCMQG
jgi:hypothetical protein